MGVKFCRPCRGLVGGRPVTHGWHRGLLSAAAPRLAMYYPNLTPTDNDFWQKFWRLHEKLRQPDAGNILRPPVGKPNSNQSLLTSAPTD